MEPNKIPTFYDAKKIDGIFNDDLSPATPRLVSHSFTMNQEQETIEMESNVCSNGKIDVESFKPPDLPPGSDDCLILTRIEKLTPSDFSNEVRPKLDVKHYFDEIQVMIDLDKLSIEQVMDEMIARTFCNEDVSLIDQTKRAVFLENSNVSLADVIQGFGEEYGSCVLDPSWLGVMATVPGVKRRRITIARLKHQMNFGPQAASVDFVILVVVSTEEKATKSAVETGRTMGTLFCDEKLRMELRDTHDEDSFRKILIKKSQTISSPHSVIDKSEPKELLSCGGHLWENIQRRAELYVSDFTDGVKDCRTINKVLSTTIFLLFTIILPSVAFGSLASKNTEGKIDANRAVIGQIIGGLLWSVLSGQPMLIIATTALVSLYSKVVYDMSIVLGADFYTVYAWVGIWNTLYLSLYALFGVSNFIKFSTRSVEEIFTLFITTCFCVDAISDIVAGKV